MLAYGVIHQGLVEESGVIRVVMTMRVITMRTMRTMRTMITMRAMRTMVVGVIVVVVVVLLLQDLGHGVLEHLVVGVTLGEIRYNNQYMSSFSFGTVSTLVVYSILSYFSISLFVSFYYSEQISLNYFKFANSITLLFPFVGESNL